MVMVIIAEGDDRHVFPFTSGLREAVVSSSAAGPGLCVGYADGGE